jgi:hypothetical protein
LENPAHRLGVMLGFFGQTAVLMQDNIFHRVPRRQQ